MTERDLGGKLALVTGGGRGIGRAIVLELARRGADVLIDFTRPEGALANVAVCRRNGIRMVIGTTGFDPSGRFLFCCNQRADAVTVFRVDRASGGLAFTGHYAPVGNPSSIVFLDLG